jgi:hypothetical protein
VNAPQPRFTNSKKLNQLFQHNFFWTLVVTPAEKRRLLHCSFSVHSANATSQTKVGFTHWIFSGILGGFSTGGLSVKNGLNRSIASANLFSVNPVPELASHFGMHRVAVRQNACDYLFL